jgi:Uncharacterised nucleotidyltransferase
MTGRAWRSFDVIAHVLGDRLRGSEASPELRAMVRAHAIDWERVLRQASGDLVLPALAAALRDLDLSRSVDEELRAFLEAVHGANVERNRELRGELRAVIGVLNRVGIEPVLLKGAIRLVDGLYPDDGWRMLRDLDLLVPEARWAAAVQALQQEELTKRARIDERTEEILTGIEWSDQGKLPKVVSRFLDRKRYRKASWARPMFVAGMKAGKRTMAKIPEDKPDGAEGEP